MKASFLLIAMLVGTSAAGAEGAIKLRAGEHSDYSRIVIPDVTQQWSISAADRIVEVTFSSETPGFDLSDLTAKRKAHRVLSAKFSKRDERSVLTLTLACECSIKATQNAASAVIIDVYDGRGEVDASAKPVTAESVNDQTATTTANLQQPSLVLPGIKNVKEETLTEETAQKPTPENLILARDRMIALLAEARARGVVQIKGASDNGDAVIGAPLTANVAVEQNASNNEPATEPTEPSEPVVCIDPARFSDRPQEARDYETILAYRQEMDKAVGEERTQAARELAGAYLRIGFFEEASAVALSTEDGNDGELSLVAAVADLAGAAQANSEAIFGKYASCSPAYELLSAAVEARDGAAYAAGLSETQVNALNALMRSLRGPIAEIFALNAIDHEETALLSRFYEIASRARAPELTPALAIIEAALPDASTQPGVIDEPLLNIAQTPGPMQARALGEIAAQYESDASIAYEGFLEDLAAQKSQASGTHGNARASIAGAKALASAGRIIESIDLLANAAASSTAARTAARTLAQSILMNALAGDNESARFLTVAAFLQHRDFIASGSGEDDELVLSIARELAILGSASLVETVIDASPHKRTRPEFNVIKALAHFNAGDYQSALALTEQYSESIEAAMIAARAAERLGDKSAAINAVKRAMRHGETNAEIAAAAWRTGEWKLAANAYGRLSSESADDGAKHALAALMSGAKSAPESAIRALANDPKALETSQHMFAKAPYFSPSNLKEVAAYAAGVANETARIRERLNDE